MSEPAAPRASTSDLGKLRIDRSGEAAKGSGAGPVALLLVFALGAAAGASGFAAYSRTRAGTVASSPSPSSTASGTGTATQAASASVVAASTSTSTSTIASSNPEAGSLKPDAPSSNTADAPRELLVASGYIIARREAQVGAKVSGRLAWLGVEAGSIVKEGDVIGRLEDADLRAELDLAKAQLERAEKLVGRYLAARTGTTENDIDAASAELKVARARVAEAEARLADTVIRAPFAGVVVEKRAEVGETVSPLATTNQLTPTGIARLVDFATLEAEVDVSERFVKKLAEGQPAVIEIAAFPGRRFRGELRQIIPTSSREKAIVEVRVAFVERDATILPNMGAKVTFYERGER